MDVPTVPALNRGPAFWATLRFPSLSMERSQHLPLRYPYPPPDVLWLSSQGVRYSQVPSSCHHYATLTGSGDTPWWLRYCQLWAEAFEPKLSSLSLNEGNNWVRKELGRAGTNLCLKIQTCRKGILNFSQLDLISPIFSLRMWSQSSLLSLYYSVASEHLGGLRWCPGEGGPGLHPQRLLFILVPGSHLIQSAPMVAEASSFLSFLPCLETKKPCWGCNGAWRTLEGCNRSRGRLPAVAALVRRPRPQASSQLGRNCHPATISGLAHLLVGASVGPSPKQVTVREQLSTSDH